jgi:(1->4)-alpha-D-glucan 1-alpha-D-glucosylmutase
MKPTSTYRIQFRNGMTLDRAAEFVPYLKALGISHLYASPIFTATSGSTHGYDVTDCNEIDPAIGGRDGFERLSAALQGAGLGLILDIVPNHMAASTENAWWANVLRYGPNSKYASYFDLDWAERLTLPILGKPFEEALADDEIRLVRDTQSGEWSLAYYETQLPLDPQSVAEIGGGAEDKAVIARIHAAQHWCLTCWKEAPRHLSYRRFFEVTGLVGLRVEDEAVFADSHRLALDLVQSGKVDGLRLDHIDGLADPAAYLTRLREKTGSETYIVVEKIFGHGETLPKSWPVDGTTGYEFITALSNLYIAGNGIEELAEAYAGLSPETSNFSDGLRAAKMLMAERNFEGEVSRLVRIARSVHPHIKESYLAEAIRELLVAFPVYRTYGRAGKMDAENCAVLDTVASLAAKHVSDRQALDAVTSLIGNGSTSEEFQRRFQQLSGPVMAKAMEDTLFYRHNRLLAANEVGGEPDKRPGGVDGFHSQMQERAKLQPHGLSATSTHDTKRGEDARARLYSLSEAPDLWTRGVERWRKMNRDSVVELPAGPAPEPNSEWMLYQALAGIWPPPERPRQGELEALTDRFVAYTEKAIREAKLGTSWNEQNAEYEEAVKGYAATLTSSGRPAFQADFSEVLAPLAAAGYVNSLSQTVIKLTAPGIPDFYQGAEVFDFSLVDPDNRRPLETADLVGLLATGGSSAELDARALKQRIIAIGLHLRKRQPALFAEGQYLPLAVSGIRRDHVVAFARVLAGNFAITVAPRLLLGSLTSGQLFSDPGFWGDTTIHFPGVLQGRKRDLLNEAMFEPGEAIPVSKLLGVQAVALIEQSN